MNGYISTSVLSGNLVRLAENIRDTKGAEIHTGVILDTLSNFTNEMLAAANRTPLDALVIALADVKPNQKIQLIKRIRELCGLGLKEAKDAVEELLPQAIVIQIERLYGDLVVANSSVSWNQTRYPNQTILQHEATTPKKLQDEVEPDDEPW